MLQILTNAIASLANACDRLINETTTQNVLPNEVSFLFFLHHPSNKLTVSSCYPSACPGAEERAVVEEAYTRESLIIPLPNTKTASDGATFSDNRTKTAVASSAKTQTFSQSAKTVRKSRPENAESQRIRCQTFSQTPLIPPFLPHTLRLHVHFQRLRSLQQLSLLTQC